MCWDDEVSKSDGFVGVAQTYSVACDIQDKDGSGGVGACQPCAWDGFTSRNSSDHFFDP